MSSEAVQRFEILNGILAKDKTFFQDGQVATIPFNCDDRFIKELTSKIEAAGEKVPDKYKNGYIKPLFTNLEKLVRKLTKRQLGQFNFTNYVLLTQMVNAALQLAPGSGIDKAVRSLQAFVDALYTSFLDSRIIKVNTAPVDHKIPPLVSFIGNIPSDISNLPPMPRTLELEQLRDLVGKLADDFTAGVVGLPPGYSERPLLWGVIGHEVMGHYLLTADRKDQWLAELQDKIFQMVKVASPRLVADQLAALWRYWTEEAAADVCAVLALGPCYGIGAVSFYTALMPLSKWTEETKLQTIYDEDDAHPISSLIPHLICGAIDALEGKLSKDSRENYTGELLEIGMAYTEAKVDGIEIVEFPIGSRVWHPRDPYQMPINLPVALPLSTMQESARLVGRFIATEKLDKLGCALGELMSWGDEDEKAANAVANLAPKDFTTEYASKTGKWEKRHVLAGGILALTHDPNLYDPINKAINETFTQG